MLTALTQDQLDAIAPIGADGGISVSTEALSFILGEALGVALPSVAITAADYDQHDDGTPEPATRTVKGIAWVSLGENRCNKWSFRSDGLALSTTDEGIQPCPISEDDELIARAIVVIADGYPESIINPNTGRIEALLPSGETKKIRVVVVHDPRITRPEDVLSEIELIALGAGTLGLALVKPVEGGQAIVRKVGL
jgi:hypothetical protein